MRASELQTDSETLALFACSLHDDAYFRGMNSRHKKTMIAVFQDPVSATIYWADIEALLIAVGARLIEGRGFRIRFEKDGVVVSFHRPHPEKEAKRYQVKDARSFLLHIGEKP